MLDVVEAAKQKSGENNSLWSLTWKVIFGVADKAEPNQSWIDTIAQIWNDFNTKIILGMRYNLANKSDYYDATVGDHVALYKSPLTSQTDPRRFVLVAHSQGNRYGNVALQRLEKDVMALPNGTKYLKRFAMVGVGSAADYVYKDGPYETSTGDMVINAVRAIYMSVLWPNLSMPTNVEYQLPADDGKSISIVDHTGHGFASVYSHSAYEGRTSLKSMLEKQLDSLHADTGQVQEYYPSYHWYYATEFHEIGPPIPGKDYGYNADISMTCAEKYGSDLAKCQIAWQKEKDELLFTQLYITP